MSVLVVGTVAFDSIETPFGSAERILGGSASYFALAASFFTSVRIVGVIGQDFPQEYLDLFSQRNIDLEGVRRETGDTFHWRGRYHEDINIRDTLELHLNVLAVLRQNVALAQRTIRRAVTLLTESRGCACRSSLKDAIITERTKIPKQIRSDLRPIIGKYL